MSNSIYFQHNCWPRIQKFFGANKKKISLEMRITSCGFILILIYSKTFLYDENFVALNCFFTAALFLKLGQTPNLLISHTFFLYKVSSFKSSFNFFGRRTQNLRIFKNSPQNYLRSQFCMWILLLRHLISRSDILGISKVLTLFSSWIHILSCISCFPIRMLRLLSTSILSRVENFRISSGARVTLFPRWLPWRSEYFLEFQMKFCIFVEL